MRLRFVGCYDGNSHHNPTRITHERSPKCRCLRLFRLTDSATIRLDESTAADRPICSFLHASADEVVDKALAYVFAKDRDFQEFLRTPELLVPSEPSYPPHTTECRGCRAMVQPGKPARVWRPPVNCAPAVRVAALKPFVLRTGDSTLHPER